jgi:hypothetical protein
MTKAERKALSDYLRSPRSLEAVSEFLKTHWRTTYRRLQTVHKDFPLASIFYNGQACFVLREVAKAFDKQGSKGNTVKVKGRY